jgi:outer membrane protein TolC
MIVGMKKLSVCAALACAVLSSLVAEQAPASLSIEQAVDAALRNNLSVKSAATQFRIKKRANDFRHNLFYPTLSTSATAFRQNEVSPMFVGVAPDSTGIYFTPGKDTIALDLTVQEVFSPANLVLMNQISLDFQVSAIGKAKAERQIASEVKKFYYQLLVQDEAIALTRARLEAANELLRQSKVSYEVKRGTELDYLYAKTGAEGLIPELHFMETARLSALTQFQEILGFEAREDMVLTGSLDDEAIPSADDLKIDGNRFDVRESVFSVKQLKTALRLQDMTLLPDLIVQYEADPAINGPKAGTIFDGENWGQSDGGLSLTLSWNLSPFLPGSDFWVKRAELVDHLRLAEENAISAARNTLNDEKNQRRLIRDSLAKIENLKGVVRDTKRMYELTGVSYRGGAGKYLDLQSAELAWNESQIQLLNERLNLISLVYDLEAKFDGSN